MQQSRHSTRFIIKRITMTGWIQLVLLSVKTAKVTRIGAKQWWIKFPKHGQYSIHSCTIWTNAIITFKDGSIYIYDVWSFVTKSWAALRFPISICQVYALTFSRGPLAVERRTQKENWRSLSQVRKFPRNIQIHSQPKSLDRLALELDAQKLCPIYSQYFERLLIT